MAQVTPCQVGTQLPLKRGTALPEFSSYVYCGQTAVWIKMPLTEEGLGPGDIVFDGGPARSPKMGHSPPVFGPCLLWPSGHTSPLLLSSCKNCINCRKWTDFILITFCSSIEVLNSFVMHQHGKAMWIGSVAFWYCVKTTEPVKK